MNFSYVKGKYKEKSIGRFSCSKCKIAEEPFTLSDLALYTITKHYKLVRLENWNIENQIINIKLQKNK